MFSNRIARVLWSLARKQSGRNFRSACTICGPLAPSPWKVMIEYMFSVCFGSPEPFDILIREPGEPTKGELLAANDRPSELL